MIKISDADLHPHLRARMAQRGITLEEIERVLEEGWEAKDAKSGTTGKVFVFPFNQVWEARYGKGFLKEGEDDEVRI